MREANRIERVERALDVNERLAAVLAGSACGNWFAVERLIDSMPRDLDTIKDFVGGHEGLHHAASVGVILLLRLWLGYRLLSEKVSGLSKCAEANWTATEEGLELASRLAPTAASRCQEVLEDGRESMARTRNYHERAQELLDKHVGGEASSCLQALEEACRELAGVDARTAVMGNRLMSADEFDTIREGLEDISPDWSLVQDAKDALLQRAELARRILKT